MTTKIADDFAAIRQRMREVNGEKEPETAEQPLIPALSVADILGFAGGGRPPTRGWLGDDGRKELFVPDSAPSSDQAIINHAAAGAYQGAVAAVRIMRENFPRMAEMPKTNAGEIARLVREMETLLAGFCDQMDAALKRADEQFNRIEKRLALARKFAFGDLMNVISRDEEGK